MSNINLIYKYITGSHLYGTATSQSDVDIRGVFIGNIRNYFGLENVGVKRDSGGDDIEYYEIRQYIKLLADNNPNILESLYVDREHILEDTDYSRLIRKSKFIFLDKEKIYKKFAAYAYSQKRKMLVKSENYNILESATNFLTKAVSTYGNVRIGEFLSNNIWKVDPSIFRHTSKVIRIGDLGVHKNEPISAVLDKVKMRLDRFSKRSELISKYGYDTKFASHAVRLLVEAKELLDNGCLKFPLSDSPLLSAIRGGEYSLGDVMQMIDNFEVELNGSYAHSSVERTDYDKVNDLLIMILEHHFFVGDLEY